MCLPGLMPHRYAVSGYRLIMEGCDVVKRSAKEAVSEAADDPDLMSAITQIKLAKYQYDKCYAKLAAPRCC